MTAEITGTIHNNKTSKAQALIMTVNNSIRVIIPLQESTAVAACCRDDTMAIKKKELRSADQGINADLKVLFDNNH